MAGCGAERIMWQSLPLVIFSLVPNISLDVLQPSFPEILLESHMVMIRVLRPLLIPSKSKPEVLREALGHPQIESTEQ